MVIITVMKDIVLQILLAAVTAGLFCVLPKDWITGYFKRSGKSQLHLEWVILLACLPSIWLCTLFQHELIPGVILNLGIVTLMTGVLYGNTLTGIILLCSSMLLHFGASDLSSLSNIVLHSGVLLIPLLWLASFHFKMRSTAQKYWIISTMSAIHWSLASLIPWLSFDYTYLYRLPVAAILLSSLAAMLLLPLLHVYTIERITESQQRSRDFDQLMTKYLNEADKFRQISEALPLAVMVLDHQESVVFMNKIMLRLYQRDQSSLQLEDVIGKKVPEFTSPLYMNGFRRRFQSVLGGDKVTELLRYGQHSYLSNLAPLRDYQTQEITGVLISTQDTTELEVLRSEMGNVERLSLVGQMAAGITHEIRNPMAVVRGFLQLMREKSPASLHHYYRIVMDELDRANGIITDFLSLAQNRAVEKEEMHLHSIIQELSPLLWADANLRGQSIDIRLSDNVSSLHMNSKEMKQLILNLSRNAMEAMNDKGTLTLSTRSSPDYVELEVHDTGPGIPQSEIDRLFEPFYTTKNKGTGLGLALCMSIAERHHGTIIVKSAEGEGTSFIVKFRKMAEVSAV